MKPASLVRIIRHMDDAFGSVMMFGHNPSLSELASVLVDGYAQDIPKAGVLGIQFDVDRWNAVAARHGEVCLDEAPARKT
jgi:phosphohistidine phosphatase